MRRPAARRSRSAVELLEDRRLLAAIPVISEFVADNSILDDQDGESTDWIELHNAGDAPINLAGWHLTDDATVLDMWTFPSVTLAPRAFLTVFASGKDRAVAGAQLHTNFQLAAAGEYLALVEPDGATVAYDFSPSYPPQLPNVGYGLTGSLSIASGAVARTRVPTAADAGLNTAWRDRTFVDTSWTLGATGVGYERSTGYEALIGTNVNAAMYNITQTSWTRIHFNVPSAAAVDGLLLRMKYDDGFAAFLNGAPIGSRNAPASLAYNSGATAIHEDVDAVIFEDIDVSAFVGNLVDGDNVLAIHGLNAGTTSSDYLILPELYSLSTSTAAVGYLPTTTPAMSNVAGASGFVGDTRFDRERGFFDAPFQVSILAEDAGAQIRYTTNGSQPTATTGTVYTGPITINKTTTLRAAAFIPGMLPSNTDTQTYVFVNDVITQSPAGQTPTGWPSTWGANVVNYGMDPDIVNNPTYTQQLKDGLKAIPSIALSVHLGDLFDASTGIYANATQDGRDWERPVSVELLNPDNTEGFQHDGGLRIRGGDSRNPQNPKHSLRLFFRGEYDGDLEYPLFGPDGAQSISKFDLRVDQVVSWANRYASSWGVSATMLRDMWNKDAALALGVTQPRGDIYHVYINGQYWGLYMTEERPESDYSTSYFGESVGGYDTILPDADVDFQIRATDGDLTAWNQVWTQASAGLTTTAAYQRIQGNNPDGTRNPAFPILVDVDSLIDYMLGNQYAANFDGPIAYFLSNSRPRNFFMTRPRDGSHGFRFFMHDMEHTLLAIPGDPVFNVNANRLGPFSAGDQFVYSNPQWLWQKFNANADFKLRQADRIHELFFNGGVYTPTKATALYQARVAQIDKAIVGESARWGDAQVVSPYTKVHWTTANNTILNGFFPTRTNVVLSQFRTAGLYPTIAAPEFSPQHGGTITAPFPLSITNPGGVGTIYYTTDGSDPRLPDGTINGTAYAGPITLDRSTTVKARIRSGTTWSALLSADYATDISALKISEIMYNPAEPNEAEIVAGFTDNDSFEFIELVNTSANPLNVAQAQLTQGVTFSFPNLTLASGERAVIVRDAAAFATRYGAEVIVAGTYTGLLSDDGETLTLASIAGEPIQSFTYDDGWYIHTDGEGFSLVAVDPTNPSFDLNSASGWRPSAFVHGGPTVPDPGLSPGIVIINEAVSNSTTPGGDWVELFNTTAEPVDVSGWFLADSPLNPTQYRIADGTVIAPHAYLVIDNPFDLLSAGAEIYLANNNGFDNVAGYREFADFPASDPEVSFGVVTKSTGGTDFAELVTPTPGAANAGPRVGPVVFSEIMYHPAFGGDEYIELQNLSADEIPLFDPANPTNRWKFTSGISFEFPEGAAIPAFGGALVVATDPAAFRSRHNVPASVPIFGPYAGSLANEGEDLKLSRPGIPDGPLVPYILVDKVKYDDVAPWPTAPDGDGQSLTRAGSLAYGNDPASWLAATAGPGGFTLTQVVGRHIFYNDSSWDGNDPAVDPGDDTAIAPDKTPLLPGDTGSFANYTSFSKGITGVAIDVANLAGTLTAADFAFKTGNTNSPSTWTPLATVATVTLRPGFGAGGTTRVALTWPEGTVQQTWLQVTLLAGANSGLAADDVFYFGNAIGEAADATQHALVNATDEIQARSNQRNILNPAPIDFLYDYNRDKLVNATDQIIARTHVTNLLSALRLIVPAASAALNGPGHSPAVLADAALDEAGEEAVDLLVLRRKR